MSRKIEPQGELIKVNVEGCKNCGRVYLSTGNSMTLGQTEGWHELASVQQSKPGEGGRDIVIRVRGRVWDRNILGKRICPQCR